MGQSVWRNGLLSFHLGSMESCYNALVTMTVFDDVLLIGSGPAGLALTAALAETGLQVRGLNPALPDTPWPNTYGLWRDELTVPGLSSAWLGKQWADGVVYAGEQAKKLGRTYGLLDNGRLQAHLLERCAQGGVQWEQGRAATIRHTPTHSHVTTTDGRTLTARLVIDASGHQPIFVQRPSRGDVAYQVAYGIIGRFSQPPVRPQQLVLMDFRDDHLTAEERPLPPTFLYAMDFGDDIYFVEETSLASYPPLPFEVLEQRLHRRLAHQGVTLVEAQHVEHCLFPMDMPLPDLEQPVLGYGGAASMVHPASGYQVRAALQLAPEVAQAVAAALANGRNSPAAVAQAGWQAIWPAERIRQRNLYLFGLANLLRFDAPQIQDFFATFFDLPPHLWAGYLSNRLATNELLQTMWQLFWQAPGNVRWSLATSVGSAREVLWEAMRG
jgi:lycopene beta-cyclase